MNKQATQEPAADAVSEVSAPINDNEQVNTDSGEPEQFISKAQEIGDMIADEASKQNDSEPEDDSDSDDSQVLDDNLGIDSDIENLLAELSDEEVEALSSLSDEDLQAEIEKKKSGEDNSDFSPNVQKRIDGLTARAKKAEEELEKLKALVEQPKEKKEEVKKEVTISDAELVKAMKDFMDEGDAQGVMDVINYKMKHSAEKLREEYKNEQLKTQETAKKRALEWQTIQKDFSPETYDVEELKSDPDFDIRNANSALYKMAEQLYSQNESGKYTNNMRKAVEDAFLTLMKSLLKNKKRTKSASETEGLKNRLLKEQKKKSLSSGPSSKDDSKGGQPKKKLSELDEVLEERRSFKNKRTGF